ncbi:MAG TPA: Crp/Fnr family transcriptional regulator [Feifaniaceae bacterium]|nr:Crp/Fnr family transcriptional regulator [Feifaniaceae bacterium]
MAGTKNSLNALFPVWDEMAESDRALLERAATERVVPQGTVLQNGSADCVGLFLVQSGQLRAYILSDGGREVTLYRLFERDMCLFSASCLLNGIQFDIWVEAERETRLWVLPAGAYQELMKSSLPVANYTNELLASRFSDIMWLLDAVLFQSVDARLAAFLLEESGIEGSDALSITHERIAHHLGTAREVVTRMLKYFQDEGIVRLSRGGVALTDRKKLAALLK